MRRLLLVSLGLLLMAPLGLIDESGRQLGLGLYVAFFGMPFGMTLFVIGACDIQEPRSSHSFIGDS